LGNLTSQLFANIYLDELDKFIKHRLRARFYLRYTDDFIIVRQDKNYLKELIPEINEFLR
ncbi:MAG: RNA-directed DNA polymerase, partial [Candidatus Parcubacteria bacterium]|nr:RNA-directed DNA polymerase [Candidatus Parcubacteria bacterium]